MSSTASASARTRTPRSSVLPRLARAGGLLVAAYTLCFLLLHALPGDPLDRLEAAPIDAAQARRTREALGLDAPLPRQYWSTLNAYLHGELGASLRYRRPVAQVLAAALPYTALLGASALLLALGAGLLGAAGAAALPHPSRRIVEIGVLWLATAPRFWLGLLLVLLFADALGWLPASHARAPGGAGPGDVLAHLVLPAWTLALPTAAVIARYQLALLDTMRAAPHVRAARAAGETGARLAWRHIVRPSLAPTLALLAVNVPGLVSGAIVVEVVFAWPGLGRASVEAILGGDYPLALAATLSSAGAVIAGRWLAAALERWFHPPAFGEGA